jgi:soluble cytochrome b562
MAGGKKSKAGKKWITAIDAASKTLEKTGSIKAAKKSLKKQALFNARKLFGSV